MPVWGKLLISRERRKTVRVEGFKITRRKKKMYSRTERGQETKNEKNGLAGLGNFLISRERRKKHSRTERR